MQWMTDDALDELWPEKDNPSRGCYRASSFTLDLLNKGSRTNYIKLGIMNNEVVFFPINDSKKKHWSLLVLYKSLNKMVYYDSMLNTNTTSKDVYKQLFTALDRKSTRL